MISIIMPSYNRAHTLPRAINSILAQDYTDWELIVVDDGSSDNTVEVLRSYADPRIRVIRHPQNKGVHAAINTGFNNIRGAWFTLLGSDDELVVPGALTTFMEVPKKVDGKIDNISCNCIDSITGEFSGVGLHQDHYLDWREFLEKSRGEHWGLIKRELLGDDRLDERIRGFEDMLWNRINKRSHHYYIDKGLRIYHTEGDDRLRDPLRFEDKRSKAELYPTYCALLEHQEYLNDCREYAPDVYRALMFNAGCTFLANRDKRRALHVIRQLLTSRGGMVRGLTLLLSIPLGEGFIQVIRGGGKKLRIGT
jgi:glycosyltransferase involved in cell wall biosynthesis